MSRSFELRLNRTWNAPVQDMDEEFPEAQPMWVITSIFPELNDKGEVLEIVGCCTDIRYGCPCTLLCRFLQSPSQQKWGEKLQATQASRAQESKR